MKMNKCKICGSYPFCIPPTPPIGILPFSFGVIRCSNKKCPTHKFFYLIKNDKEFEEAKILWNTNYGIKIKEERSND